MEGGRRVHPQHPNEVFTDEDIHVYDDPENGETAEFTTRRLGSPVTTRHWDGRDYVSNYAAGGIYSVDAYTYGRFSIRAKLPKGSAAHAAFWLSGDKTWPPEIDCFETYNTFRGKTLSWPDPFRQFANGFASDILKWNCIIPVRRVQPNIHWNTAYNHEDLRTFNVPFNFFDDPYNGFNEYDILWMPELIKIHYNGYPVLECRDTNILKWFNEYPMMHVILDNSYTRKVTDGVKDEADLPKTPFIVYGFEYEKL